MPMTFPSMFSSGPPELPGLIEASVWMKSVNVRPSSFDGTERPSAETTPVVTEPLRPNGLPTATTVSPIIRSDDVPIGAIGAGACRGSIVCDSAAGLQPIVSRKTNRRVGLFFMLTYTTSMKLKMIFNPMAGRGRARKQIGRALAYLRERGADVDCVPS